MLKRPTWQRNAGSLWPKINEKLNPSNNHKSEGKSILLPNWALRNVTGQVQTRQCLRPKKLDNLYQQLLRPVIKKGITMWNWSKDKQIELWTILENAEIESYIPALWRQCLCSVEGKKDDPGTIGYKYEKI
jgi:hypothetical protein